MSERLELRMDKELLDDLKTAARCLGCSISDISRASLKLGLKELQSNAGSTGLPVAHWIAALNGKVK